MDHYPKGVRSAILDSTYPMQTNVFVEEAGAMERSLELITERCKADAACNRKYPDVKNVFFDLVAKLDQHPRGMMTGNGFIETVWGWLYAADFIPVLPLILYEFNAGNWTDLPSQPSSAASINTPPEATMSEGKRFSVICAEEIPQTSPQEIQAVNQNTSARLMDYFNEPIFKICSIWGVTPEDQSNFEPVSSNIPAIIFQGDYDLATPPAWGKLTAQNLKNSYFLEFTGLSHSVLGAGAGGGKCSKSIMQAFLENPHVKPEINCLEDLKIYFITANL
jgi:pimeloyl-ACP methyl ester carboxylesterase